MGSLIFLLGAGASFDAGMPLVAQLTEQLKERLGELRDMNGELRPEFPELFDAIADHDPEISYNYERFFEWLAFLVRAQTGSFGKVVDFRLDQRLVAAAPYLAWSIKLPVWKVLRSRHRDPSYKPDYLARLADLLPAKGRLKVFSTNYDLCVEDACHTHGCDLTTGFDPNTGRWRPSLLRGGASGITIFKLHGSLNWGLSDNGNAGDRPLVERYPPSWEIEPELLLGPGSKLQSDDPFVSLYGEFHQALGRAKTCVAIGCSFRDPHIEKPLREASRRGMLVIDVNPTSGIQFERYTPMRMGAREALESGAILKAVKRL